MSTNEPIIFRGEAAKSGVTFYIGPPDGSEAPAEMLRIEADAFYVRGAKVEQGPGEAREVYDAFVKWMAAAKNGSAS